MRLRGWWFSGLGALLLILFAVRHLDLPDAIGSGGASVDAGSSRRSLAYRVPADGALSFDLPPGVSHLRLLTNADLVDSRPEREPVHGWRYAVALEMVGWGGDARVTREYHFRSRISRGGRTPTGHVVPSSRYQRSTARPLDGRLAPLRLDGLGFRPAQLKVSLHSMDSDLAGVSVRAYYREEVSEFRRHAMWPRLSLLEREKRAEGNVYPQDLLNEHEKQELVRYSWPPLSPAGVTGKDFERRVLLQAAQREPSPSAAAYRPIGLALMPGVRGVVRVDEPTSLRLEAVALDGDQQLSPGEVVVRFIDRAGGIRDGFAGAPRARGVAYSLELPAGWLEVKVPVRAVVSVSMGNQEEDRFAPLEPDSVVGYLCRPGSSVEYRILSLGSADTPFRVDLRALGASRNATAGYRVHAADGSELSAGSLTHSGELSAYDWADGLERSERVSEPSRHYLSLPADADRLVLEGCTEPLVVTAYNHPPDLVWRIPVPQTVERRPSRRWFRVRPLDADSRKERGESRMLRLQERPEEPRAVVPDDALVAESYDLGEGEIGRYVLIPERAARGRSSTAPGAGFTEIPDGRPVAAELGDRTGGAVRPTLLFRRSVAAPFRLRVEVDGRSLLDEEFVGRQGEVPLPAFAGGRHRLLVEGDGQTTFFLNRARVAGAPVYGRRFVRRLPGRSFDVPVKKAGPHVVTGRLYFPSGGNPSCSLGVEIQGSPRRRDRGSTTWTFRQRLYEVRGPMESRVPAVGDDRLWMERSAPFFVALGDDLPPGPYRLRFSPRCSGEAYATLSHLRAPPEDTRRFFLETDFAPSGTGGRSATESAASP